MPEKTALVVSGGSAKGAFAVGVAQELVERFDVGFDLVAGTSTGALVAPLAVTEEWAELEALYAGFSASELLEGHTALEAFHFGYLYGTDGLRELADRVYTGARFREIRDSGKQMFITTVSLQSGRVVYFFTGPDVEEFRDDDADPSRPHFVRIRDRETLLEAVLASAMQPVIMEPVVIDGEQHVDGGVREKVPLAVAIDHGAERVFGVELTAREEQAGDQTFTKLPDTALRTIGLLIAEGTRNEFELARLHNDAVVWLGGVREKLHAAFPGATDRVDEILDAGDNPFAASRVVELHIIRPEERLLEDGLAFDEADMRRMIRLGRERVEACFPDGIPEASTDCE